MAFGDLLAAADRQTVDLLGGETIHYTPVGGPTVLPTGIFDAAYSGIDGGNHAQVNGSHPAAFFLLVDLPLDPETDNPALVIRGVGYTVAEVHKDQQGGVLLVLRKA